MNDGRTLLAHKAEYAVDLRNRKTGLAEIPGTWAAFPIMAARSLPPHAR